MNQRRSEEATPKFVVRTTCNTIHSFPNETSAPAQFFGKMTKERARTRAVVPRIIATGDYVWAPHQFSESVQRYPGIWFYNVAGPLDYQLPIIPLPQLNNRKLNMPLGHVLGGGTSINAMVWTRGMPRNFDGWAKNGAPGWAFADVLPVFKKQEDWEGGSNDWRGAGGPVHIRRPRDPHPTAPAFIEAAREMGMPILDDVNGPMRPGAGYINMNIVADGTRVRAVRAFLRPALSRPNLRLLLNTHSKGLVAWASKS